LNFVVWVAVVGPLFFYLATPYAVVGGEYTYVQWDELLSPSQWRENVERSVGTVDKDFLTPIAGNMFTHHLVEYVAKIIMPFIDIVMSSSPLWDQTLRFAVSLVLAIEAYVNPYLHNRSFQAVLCGARLCVVWTFAMAILTAQIADTDNYLTTILLGGGLVILGACSAVRAYHLEEGPRNVLLLEVGEGGPGVRVTRRSLF